MKNAKNERPARTKGQEGNTEGKVSKGKPIKPKQVDRPGFDLGGSTGETSAGSGLGLGRDASENRRDRSLPRRGKD
jgi:hypothetical protein